MKRANRRSHSSRLSWPVVVVASGLLVGSAPTLLSAPASVPGRILLKPAAGVDEAELHGLFRQHGAVETDKIAAIDVRILKVPDAARDRVLEALQHNSKIEFAEADAIVEPALVPNDPNYASEWHLPKIQAPQAWDVTTGSSNVVIAILDTGVDGTHPDLVANMVSGWNFFDNNSDTSDVYGHGTAVAGAAAVASNNGTGIAAPAWACKVMPIRISDTNGNGVLSAASSGLTWAADHGARVANISFAMWNSATVLSAAQYFQSKGGVVTVAAGNSGTFYSSAGSPYVLVVSATDQNDAMASWSNTGNAVDISAPGVAISVITRGGGYGGGSGTSFSAPVVAGVAALVISAKPSLSGPQVQDILTQSADDLGSAGWDPSYGYGRVNAYKAVLAATGGTSTPPADGTPPSASIAAPSAGSTVSGTATIAVAASDNVGVTKVECYVNGVLLGTSASATANFAWSTTAYANGSYTLQAKAYDAAGNLGTSATETVTVQNIVADTTAPTATITAPASGTSVAGVVSVTVSATDNVGVTKTELYLNGALAGSSATGTFSWNTTAYANGSYTLQAKAYDAAGNVGTSATKTVSVQNTLADTTAPTATIAAPTAGSIVSGVVAVTVNATDNVGVTRVDWFLSGTLAGSSATGSFSWDTTKNSDGSYNLQARVFDAAGNSSTTPIINVTVRNTADTIKPAVQITSPNSGASLVRNTKVYVSASDNVGVTRVDLLIDGKVYSTSTLANPVFSWNTSKTSRGSHTLQSLAYDAAGNSTGSAVVTVYK